MKSTGYIGKDGIYRHAPPNMEEMRPDHSSTDKEYQHDRQRESHRRDTIQPYKNGQPNKEFVQEYPELAEGYGFTH